MKKILIVEDNKDYREILSILATKFGHQVIKAGSSEEAITYAEAECPDLSFMDLELPDVDGIRQAILEKNTKTSHIPVVAVTYGCRHYGRKSFESRYHNLFAKTGLTSNIKGKNEK